MNMKFGIVLAAFLSFSTSSWSADNGSAALTSGTAVAATAAGCSLLNEEVKVNLSKDVIAAYACNTVANRIAIATCHPSGLKSTFNVQPLIDDPNYTGTGTPPKIPDETAAPISVTGGKAFTASTDGGQVLGTNSRNCLAVGGTATTEAAERAGL